MQQDPFVPLCAAVYFYLNPFFSSHNPYMICQHCVYLPNYIIQYHTIHTIPTYDFRYLFRNIIIILYTVYCIYNTIYYIH